MKISLMHTRTLALSLLAAAAVFATGCGTSRIAAGSEYDDVYVTQSDIRAEQEALAQEQALARQQRTLPENDYSQGYDDNNGFNSPAPVAPYRPESFSEEFYDEDDFYYSRRLRRFDSPARNSWRYYDPFFANDLYFIMGTPSWSNWYGNGWYNWNYPRFGSNWMYAGGFQPGFGMGMGFGDPFMNPWGWNTGFYNGFYNPWAGAYYGCAPWGFSPMGFNAWGYNPYSPWGGGYYGSGAFFSPYAAGGMNYAEPRLVSRTPRQSAMSSVSQTSLSDGNAGTRPGVAPVTGTRPAAVPATTARSSSFNNQYLRPRTPEEMPARSSSVSPAGRPVSTPSSGDRVISPATPARSSGAVDRNTPVDRPSTVRPSSPTSPERSVRPSTPSPTVRPSSPSPSTRPSSPSPSVRPSSPSPSRPSYDRPSPSYDRPSPSYDRPSPSPSRSYSPPSGGGGGSRPSSPSPAPRRP